MRIKSGTDDEISFMRAQNVNKLKVIFIDNEVKIMCAPKSSTHALILDFAKTLTCGPVDPC